jgi:hypothetical protein
MGKKDGTDGWGDDTTKTDLAQDAKREPVAIRLPFGTADACTASGLIILFNKAA